MAEDPSWTKFQLSPYQALLAFVDVRCQSNVLDCLLELLGLMCRLLSAQPGPVRADFASIVARQTC